MSSRRKRVTAPRTGLVTAGLSAAVVLPFFLLSTASADVLRESKLVVQALGVAVALAGLAAGASAGWPRPAGRARLVPFALGAGLSIAAVSALANRARIDPLTSVAVLSPLALLLCGASAPGEHAARRVQPMLMAAGAVTGLLAALQRFAGVFRFPFDAPEPRFFAAGLIGNPGDVGTALVIPALLLWAAAADPGPSGRRSAAAVGLLAVLLGLGATETVGAFLALGAGVLLHTLLDLRARWRPLVLATLLLILAAIPTGAGRRLLVKLDQVRRGNLADATTQRDQGAWAALEMIRGHPALGIGPGAFSTVFVPARLAAEERLGRRFVHGSTSAHFENAHSEPLTLAAECGLPAAILFLGAGIALVALLIARRDPLAPPLAAFGVLALAGFPLRLAIVCGPAAFLAGVAFRRLTAEGSPAQGRTTRGGLLLGACALATLALVRYEAFLLQADGEARILTADTLQGTGREVLLDEARLSLKRSLALRPRGATAWLALGSVQRLEHEPRAAELSYRRSLALEERAETDLNVGRTRLLEGAPDEARLFFVRAVWILPRLIDAVPPAGDPAGVAADVERLEVALGRGGHAPPLPTGAAATPRSPSGP